MARWQVVFVASAPVIAFVGLLTLGSISAGESAIVAVTVGALSWLNMVAMNRRIQRVQERVRRRHRL